jgi:hypothetical protein
MAMSANSVAYGTVVIATVLFSISTHAERLQAAPTSNAVQLAQATPAPTTATGAGVTLHSLNAELPQSDRLFPGGASADVANNNCLACHSAGMVLTQPPLSRAAWEDEVNKMRNAYKAPIAAEDVPAIVDYLMSVKGAK